MRLRNSAALIALLAGLGLSGCSTTDAVSLPFDLASTTGDSATSSSSTSGGDDTQASLQQERFVRSQISWIERDAARGQGESLVALAELLGETDSQAFSLWTQQNYDALFAQLEHPEDLLTRIRSLRN